MTAQPTRRSARILALSTAVNKLSIPPSKSTFPSKSARASSAGRPKRKVQAANLDASATEDTGRSPKRRRMNAGAYTVRSKPDPQYTDPAFIAKAREEYRTTARNPLHAVPIWGRNPFKEMWKGHKFPDPKIHALPPMDPVGPLKRLNIRYRELSCVEVVRDENEEGVDYSSIFRVRYKGKGYILKLFHSTVIPDCVAECGPHKFAREKRAYERLLHHGVCAQGFVPMCYGWFELRVPKRSQWLRSFASDEKPPYALLIEDVADAETLSVLNISVPIAEQALLAAEHLHEAGVLHNDLLPRNTLVRRDGTVVIIDFDKASTWPHEDVDLLALKQEMQLCWCIYFAHMLTDQLMGLTPDEVSY
ncbi:hypothetical protein OE88DRAFT_1738876 [Heliocybe sulcata]|uniref:Protein kinase domain-containing protein n=1 Tax=Heliocybe sulcata TaxID=5364 RepID=A0A5C3MP94_9AGAM|nr:hypothetical protein OE88DRAFT_1738876 [Heliocybe sulcata]